MFEAGDILVLLASPPQLRWSITDRPMIGINCLQPFGYGYPFSNGGNDATVMPDARLQLIRTTGFDFVRMAVDPEALLTADSASNVTTTVLDARIAEIVTGVSRRLSAGLRVIVDLHFHGASVSISSGWQYTDVFDGLGGTKYTRLKFVGTRLAAAIHANFIGSTGLVAFELFNEPPPTYTGVSTSTYITHIEDYWIGVRAVMPLHTIVVGGNSYNAVDGTSEGTSPVGLTALTASHFDGNTSFAFHVYEAPVFALQATSGSIYEYMHNLSFPASTYAGGQSAAESAFTTAAGGDSNAINSVVTQTTWFSSLHNYFSNLGTGAQLKTRQDIATAWAASASIANKRIAITEFGVNFGGSDDADDTSALNYVQAIRDNAFTANIGCVTIHELQDPGGGSKFGVSSGSSPYAFNSSILSGLRLV